MSLAQRIIFEPLLRTTSKMEFMKIMKRSGPRIDPLVRNSWCDLESSWGVAIQDHMLKPGKEGTTDSDMLQALQEEMM